MPFQLLAALGLFVGSKILFGLSQHQRKRRLAGTVVPEVSAWPGVPLIVTGLRPGQIVLSIFRLCASKPSSSLYADPSRSRIRLGGYVPYFCLKASRAAVSLPMSSTCWATRAVIQAP